MRHILKPMAQMGASSLVTMAANIVKYKVLALVLGPTGVGALGVLQSVFNTGSTLATLGLNNSGVKQVAEARGQQDDAQLAALQRALTHLALGTGLLVALILVLGREWLATRLMGDVQLAAQVGWLALGVPVAAWSAAQLAWINGFRRIKALATANILAAVASAAVSALAIQLWRADGLIVFLLSQPVLTLVITSFFASRIPAPAVPFDRSQYLRALRALASLGSVTMFASLLAMLTQLALRALLAQRLDLAAVGQFQAGSTLSAMYLGFAMTAMSTDYYPRLAEVSHDPGRMGRVINEQVHMSMLAIAPLCLGMLALAAPLVTLLYSAAFTPAAGVLHWALLGDIFKVPGYIFSYVLLVQNRRLAYVGVELLWNASLLGVTWALLPVIGVEAGGIGYLAAQASYALALWALLHHGIGFRWTRANGILLALVALSCGLLFMLPEGAWYTWPVRGLVVGGGGLAALQRLIQAYRGRLTPVLEPVA